MFGGITIIWVQLRGAAQGAPARVVCGAGLLCRCRVLLHCQWCVPFGACLLWSWLAGIASDCHSSVVLEWLVRFGAGMLVPAAGCCCRLLLQGAGLAVLLQDAAAGCQSAVRFGAGVLVPLRGAGCRCKLLLQGAAAKWRVRCGGGLPVPLQCAVGVSMLGAAAECAAVRVWCCCRVRV